MEFQIISESKEFESLGKVAVLKFVGPIDQKSMQSIESAIGEFYKQDIKYYIFDFAETHNINSTGIGVLINITHHISMANGSACLINASKFKNLIDTIGLSDRLPMFDNETSAIEHMKSSS